MQIAEAALADEYVSHGDRLALQRRVLRLGKPPRRWRRPPWAAAAMSEPQEVLLIAKPLTSTIGARPSSKRCCCGCCGCAGPACGLQSSDAFDSTAEDQQAELCFICCVAADNQLCLRHPSCKTLRRAAPAQA